ncbi:hypothetical protein [Borrelia miyamotoi]|uniref:Uncharacterized protein n=1 Tax=Borrelia miyamotoi TaxID=47466 RepID=A0AAQ2X055_9SPIR|nr:hypothetical protein [Borrelia miyamotoi]AOW95988.1 hypothetical protein AXH25_04025 [Borrelia miyamotoi]QTL83883.1 hypothetical protein bmLB2001_000804 [Borrelia miyamotoi]WAZ84811.1 hypothetical protein O5400_00195 [Borrelia miyamotoi]WAZ90593.1 hypothetical protein O5398_00195 [Borrelia miyamotoi]WAZ91877.1 hypothetical protein O5402_00195 [Borrelia miyamotoi]
MSFIELLNTFFKSRLIFLSLFLLISCLTNQDTNLSFHFIDDIEKPNIDELDVKERSYLSGLKDNEFFFLSDAFLKEDNSYFKMARESYAQKNIGMTSYYLNKIITDKKSYGKELIAKANLFFAYVNYRMGAYDLSEYNFDNFLKDYKYSHASLRIAELKYFVKDRMGAISALRDVDKFSLESDYDLGIYNFLNNKFGIIYLNLKTLGFLDNSIFDMFIFGSNVFVSNIFGGLLRYDIQNNEYKVYIKDKKSIVLNGLRGFAEHKGVIYVGGNDALYYIDDLKGLIKQVKIPLNVNLNSVQVLMSAKDGIFIGTLDSGLWFYSDMGEWTCIKLDSKRISSLYLDEQKNLLLVGTMDKSIYSIALTNFHDVKHLNFFSKVDSEKNINFIKEYDGSYYVGTYGGGLFRLNLDNHTYVKYSVNNAPSVGYFLDMEIRDNKLLFATFEHGLLIYDTASNSWDYLGPRDGLISLNLVKILNFKDYVLLGTLNNGLVFVNESIKKQL